MFLVAPGMGEPAPVAEAGRLPAASRLRSMPATMVTERAELAAGVAMLGFQRWGKLAMVREYPEAM